MRRLPVVAQVVGGRVSGARPEPPVRGEAVLAALERPFLFLERMLSSRVPPALDPVAQLGALANLMFAIACVSGGLLLFSYEASVLRAWASLEAMRGSPLMQLFRSLHRYSSDACMLLVVLHALRLTSARRIVGARWLAWVTGVLLVGLLFVVGWLGYWLVWDEPARQIALGTAKALDVLPVFAEPMSRTFLADAHMNPLLFFIVFFLHMLLPLGMGVALWLHVTRLSRPRYLPSLWMSVVATVSLTVLSLVVPARSQAPARLSSAPARIALDVFYDLPIVLTDRLSGGALWLVSLALGVLLFSVPWLLGRGRAAVAAVQLPKCNGCRTCSADCPYDAIDMVPRTDGRDFAVEARVDPSKCVGCGVCAGSCDSAGIGVPSLSVVEARTRMDAWLDKSTEHRRILFACARSAAADLNVDAQSGVAAGLPGFRVVPVGCIGWVHALTVERALRHGAEQVVLLGCSETEPACREGVAHTRARMEGLRKPALRGSRDRVLVLAHDRGQGHRLSELLGASAPRGPRPGGLLLAAVVGVVLLLASLAGSRVSYGGPPMSGPELVVSFKIAGQASTVCRDVTPEEKAKQPVHMRQDRVCERRRSPVRLRVWVDDVLRLDATYGGGGVRGDGVSVGLEHVALTTGSHKVRATLAEAADGGAGASEHHSERTIVVGARDRVVLWFERSSGFSFFGGGA